MSDTNRLETSTCAKYDSLGIKLPKIFRKVFEISDFANDIEIHYLKFRIVNDHLYYEKEEFIPDYVKIMLDEIEQTPSRPGKIIFTLATFSYLSRYKDFLLNNEKFHHMLKIKLCELVEDVTDDITLTILFLEYQKYFFEIDGSDVSEIIKKLDNSRTEYKKLEFCKEHYEMVCLR